MSDAVLLATLHPFEVTPLLERLDEAGIAYDMRNDDEAAAAGRAVRSAGATGVHVFVSPGDLARAAEIHQALIVESLPDLPEGFDPSAHDAAACPACQTPLAPDAGSCAECGLEFPESER